MEENVPPRFTCEITMNLMINPVKLPNGSIVDRNSIARHLLSSHTNPFTKEPLTIEEVVEVPNLKQEISLYKSEIFTKAGLI